jgi:hypothetical protein
VADNITIPVDSEPYSSLDTNLDGAVYTITTRWNFTESAWYMDLFSVEQATMLVRGIKLVLGEDLLKPYALVELGEMFVVDTKEGDKDPTEESLGDRHQLFYILKENRGTFI